MGNGGQIGEGAPLRVLHLVTSDAFAGIERHVVRLSRELRALGCRAELACPPTASRLRAEATASKVPVHPAAGARSGTWVMSLARRTAGDRPDAIHLHDGRSALAGVLLRTLAGGLVIRTQHFSRPASAVRAGWHGTASVALHRALNRRLDGYIAVSRSVAEAAADRNETGTAEVAVIPPGIELPSAETLAHARVAREASREPVVAYVGRLEPERRLDLLIRAIPRVRAELPNCRFVIAGAGAAECELRQLAQQLRVEDAVSWPGWVAEPDAVLKRAHVYVNPLAWEGFGMAMAEAMSFGVPVIAINSGASPEMIDHGVTGLLVPQGDPEALANEITRLAGDRAQAMAMGEAARERAAREFGVERTAEATLALYLRLRERGNR